MKKFISSHISLLVPLALLIAALISSVIIYGVRTEQYSTWIPAQEGKVVRTEDLRRFNIRIYYTYTVGGTVYDGSELFHDDPATENPGPGDSAEIWYDPDRPSLSSYGKPSPRLDPFGPMFMALPLSVGVYFILRKNSTSFRL